MNTSVPNYVAIILDGNVRWTKVRGLKKVHKTSFDNLKKLSDYIFKSGVKILSVFTFLRKILKDKKMNYLTNFNLRNDVIYSIKKYKK